MCAQYSSTILTLTSLALYQCVCTVGYYHKYLSELQILIFFFISYFCMYPNPSSIFNVYIFSSNISPIYSYTLFLYFLAAMNILYLTALLLLTTVYLAPYAWLLLYVNKILVPAVIISYFLVKAPLFVCDIIL